MFGVGSSAFGVRPDSNENERRTSNSEHRTSNEETDRSRPSPRPSPGVPGEGEMRSLLQQPHRHLTLVAMVPGVVWDGEQVAIALDDVHAAEEVVAEYVRVVAVRLRAEVSHLPAVVHAFD